MRVFLIALVALVALSSGAYAAQTWSWDFNDGTWQGWYNVGGSITPPPDNPAATLPNPMAGYGSSAYLPDKSHAWFDVTSLVAGGSNSFTFEATVGFNWLYNLADNRLQACGLALRNVGATYGGPSMWYEGKQSGSSRMRVDADSTFYNKSYIELNNVLKDTAGKSNYQMVGKMVIDYNNEVADKIVVKFFGVNFTPSAYVSSPDPAGTVAITEGGLNGIKYEWAFIKDDPLTMDNYAVGAIRIGGDNSWTQSYFDNVVFTDYNAVPEPGSIVAMFSGLVGLVGYGIRRRK